MKRVTVRGSPLTVRSATARSSLLRSLTPVTAAAVRHGWVYTVVYPGCGRVYIYPGCTGWYIPGGYIGRQGGYLPTMVHREAGRHIHPFNTVLRVLRG